MSGLASCSHSSRRGSRAFTEFTFQVARRTRLASHRPCAPLVVVLAEAVGEAAEDPALGRDWLPRQGRLGAPPALGLGAAGPGDGVPDLRLVGPVRAGGRPYEADQVRGAQDLGFT